MLDRLTQQPADALLALIKLYDADPRADKIDLGVGVYRTDDGATPVFAAVKAAERKLVAEQDSKAYLGPEGDMGFVHALMPYVFGAADPSKGGRIDGMQAPGGTGGLRLAFALAKRAGITRIVTGNPTWPNHPQILSDLGMEAVTFNHARADGTADMDALRAAIAGARDGDAILLHGCCHNPTGIDYTPEQWDEIAALLVPSMWPPSPEVAAALQRHIAAHGLRAFQQAVTGGQHDHPEGIFYGGRNPTWSNVTLRHVLQAHGRRCARLAWIDLHTGLGPSGVGERIFAGRDDAAAIARARAWWGEHITSIHDGSSTSASLTGLMWTAVDDECAQAEYTGIALEYGTVPVTEVLDALRADQWLENHPEAGAAQQEAIKRRMLAAFYTDTDAWKQAVLEQAFEAARQAVAGLAAR